MKAEEGITRICEHQVEYAGYSDIGRLRSINEDDFLLLPDQGIFCLADGLGGLEQGEIASVLALQSIKTLLEPEKHPLHFLFRKKTCSLRQMISHANDSVYKKRQKLRLNTATTMVIVRLLNHGVEIAHVGDSRVYQWDGCSLIQRTRDHSLIEEVYSRQGLSEKQLHNHPQRHVITRAVGAKTEVMPNIQRLEINNGDLLLLCSDGLTSMLSHEQIEDILHVHHTDVIHAGRALITAANNAGGRDNITVILLHIGRDVFH